MIWLVEFLVGFTLMVAFAAASTGMAIGSTYLGRWLGWEFRRRSLANEAQGVLARERVRQRAVEA